MTFMLPDLFSRVPTQRRQTDALDQLDCECCIPSPTNSQRKENRSLVARNGQGGAQTEIRKSSTDVLAAFNRRAEDLLEQAELALRSRVDPGAVQQAARGTQSPDNDLERQARRFLVRSGRNDSTIDTSPLERLARDVAALRPASTGSPVAGAREPTGATSDGVPASDIIDASPLERLARDVAGLRQGSNGSGSPATDAAAPTDAKTGLTSGEDVNISGGGAIDTSALNKAASDARALYAAIQEAAVEYEKQTAGAKLARDKAKAISG